MPKKREYEKSIVERAKLRRQRLDEVKKERKAKSISCLIITLNIQPQAI